MEGVRGARVRRRCPPFDLPHTTEADLELTTDLVDRFRLRLPLLLLLLRPLLLLLSLMVACGLVKTPFFIEAIFGLFVCLDLSGCESDRKRKKRLRLASI